MGCHVLFHSIFQTQGSTRSHALQVDSLPSEPPGNHPPAPATLAKSNKNRSALKFKGRKQKKRKVSRCLMPGVKSLQSCPSPCDPMDCSSTRLLCPWDFPGKNTGVGCHFLLRGILLTQELNCILLHWQTGSLPLSHQGSQHKQHKQHKHRSSSRFSWREQSSRN